MNINTSNKTKPNPKLEKALEHLIRQGMLGASQLTALAPPLHDTCWNTTVSKLKNKLDLTIANEWFVHTRADGTKTRFKRYWLPNQFAVNQAITTLNKLKQNNHNSPLNQAEVERIISQFPASTT